ncbi:MAG: hypothetical protein PHV82_10545 [Victivallaceae bacterium]|nr:hypothetical protein [Victivallaceae bacterium]
MKHMFIIFAAVVLAAGCSRDLSVKDPKALTSEEIVKVLKYESIEMVSATHSNKVRITLKNGKIYEGIFNPYDISEYTDNKKLHPAGNMVSHIRNKYNKTWEFMRE